MINNLLITSVGRRVYMVEYFKHALKGEGLVHAANSETTYALMSADAHVLTPNIYDSSYIDFLLSYCKENKITVLISLFDIDLPVLSKNKELFKDIGVTVLVSNFDLIQICNDKWATYQFLKGKGFKSPASFISLENVIKAIEDDKLHYPLIVKPRWGMGSIGIFEAENEEELKVFYKKTKNEILRSYLRYESQQEISDSVIIQEKIKGQEWGIDIFNDLSGEFVTCVPKRKLAMRAGETDIAKTSKNVDLYKFGKEISSHTKHVGNLDMDFFISEGEYYILEFNCRFGGQYPFSHAAGVNFPKALFQMLKGEKASESVLAYEEIKSYKDLVIHTL